MRDGTRLLVTLLVAVGLALPAGAAAAITNGTSATDATAATTAAQVSNGTQVNVTAGAQLSTVLAATESEVDAEVDETAFEVAYESADEEARAEAIAERAESLRERALGIREDYREATEAYQEGDITRDQYAQRLATLNARATTVVDGYDRLQQRAGNVSALELRAAGYNGTATREAARSLDNVSGTGASALLERFTGRSEGTVEVETANGLSVTVESEDGESRREFERAGDDDDSLDVNQSAALATAREPLTGTNGSWVLQRASIDGEDGVYEFEFRLDADGSTGEAEVTVDGSSGEVVSLEEEIEPADGDERGEEADERENEAEGEEREEEAEDEDEDADDERELALVVADGSVSANETITVRALADGEPAQNVTVSLSGEPVGETNAAGELDVTLPAGGEVELTAGEEGELEFDLGEGDDADEVLRKLSTEAALETGTVTVTVAYDGEPVRNATVYANDESVGTTDADGAASFDLGNETEELELEIVKGAFEAELEYTVDNGTLTLVESEHEGDGDHTGEREDADEDDGAEDDADDEESDDEEDEAEDDADDDESDDGDDEAEDDEESDDADDEESDEAETEDTEDETDEETEDDEQTAGPY